MDRREGGDGRRSTAAATACPSRSPYCLLLAPSSRSPPPLRLLIRGSQVYPPKRHEGCAIGPSAHLVPPLPPSRRGASGLPTSSKPPALIPGQEDAS